MSLLASRRTVSFLITCCIVQSSSFSFVLAQVVAPANIAEMRQRLCENSSQVHSLSVTVSYKQRALVDPNLLKRYLNQVYLRDDRHTIAFKGGKRYREIRQPKSAIPIGDPWVIAELPPDAPKVVVDNNKKLREQMESVRKMIKGAPHAVSFSKDPLGLPPLERWGLADGEELRHFGSDGGEIFAVGIDKYYKHPFDSEYLGAVGMLAADPVRDADKDALQDFDTSISLCQLLQSTTNHMRITADTGDDRLKIGLERSFQSLGLSWHEKFLFDLEHGMMPISRVLQDIKTSMRLRSWVFSEARQIIPGVWLPNKITMTLYAPPWADAENAGKPFIETDMVLLDVLVNDEVPDSLFEVKFDPGTKVANFPQGRKLGLRNGSPLFYNMPADDRQLESVIGEASHITPKAGFGARSWFVSGNLLLLAGMITLILVRRRIAIKNRPSTHN